MDDSSNNEKDSNEDGSISEAADENTPATRESPIQSDVVEEILAKAEALAGENGMPMQPLSFPGGALNGAGSLRDVIDRVEQQLMSSIKNLDPSQKSLPEELDALDIEAELGRPDRGADEFLEKSPEPERKEAEDNRPTLIPNFREIEEKLETAGDIKADDLPEYAAEGAYPRWYPINSNPQDFDDGEDEELIPDPSRESGADIPMDLRPGETDAVDTGLFGTDYGEKTHVFEAPTPTVGPVVPYGGGLRFQREIRDGGRLSEEPVWSLLVAAMTDRVSGMLHLERNGIERTFYLDRGDVVIATSTARDDRLVELLYRQGRLSEEEYSQAVLTIGASGRKVGAILVERGMISSRELFPLVRHHYENIILDSFSWRDGTWRFVDEEGFGGERILLEVPTATLIVEGIRSRAPRRDVEAIVPKGARVMEMPGGAICPVQEVGLLEEETALYRACDGSTDLEQLAGQFELSLFEIRALFAGLAVLGIVHIQVVDDHSVESQEVNEITQRFRRERGYRVERLRVADKMNQVREGTYFQILEVAPRASGYEIRKAYRALSGQFAVERFATPELEDLSDDVVTVRHIVDEAYEVLRNLSVREAYRQSLDDEV